MLTLYQAEWCPFSSAVRELLTELGIDFAAIQVEPYPEQRRSLETATGTNEIPVLVADDGRVFRGTREIFGYLAELPRWEHGPGHRQRYADHREAREQGATTRLLDYFPAD
jgi:glutaredoxin